MKIRLSGSLISMIVLLSAGAVNANPQPSGSAISILSAPVTISQPGTYRLANDISGDITIAASNVELNLDNRKLSPAANGVSVSSRTDVVIRNGIIEGGSENAITMTGAINVTIQDIDFVDNKQGININTSTCIQVENATFRGHSDSAIQIDDSDTISMHNIKAFENSSTTNDLNLINIENNTNNVILREYVAVNNSTTNFRLSVLNVSQSNDIKVENVCANENSSGFVAGNNTFVSFDSSNKLIMSDVLIGNNQALNLFALDLTSCQDCTLNRVEINKNAASSGEITGFLFGGTKRVQLSHCVANNNEAPSSAVGFKADTCTDILYDHCISNSNVALGGGAQARGFFAEESIKVIYNESIANDNLATDTAYGFDLRDTETSCILNSIAKRNEGLGAVGRGFFLQDCNNCLLKENVAIANKVVAGVGIGIEVIFGVAPFTTGILSNYSSDHTSNYITSPGLAPIAILSFSTGDITAVFGGTDTLASKWYNIETTP